MASRDPNTLANYGEWLTKHTTVNFKVDFEKQRLTGSVLLELESLTDKKSEEVILGSYSLDLCAFYSLSQTIKYLRLSPILNPYHVISYHLEF